MLYSIRKLYRPEYYQGPDRLASYFEGWYYKIVGDGCAFALIPGVSRAPADPHSFIQVIHGLEGRSSYHRFPLEAFGYGRDRFQVDIADNRFAGDGLTVALDDIEADLTFTKATHWRGSLLSPGTMGWYSFVPFMECRHGIIVMDAVAQGTLNGCPLESGRLYLEKDYGRSFPNAWVWFQTNTFETAATSVTCSIANVPFIGGAFTGFLAAVLVDGELHKFTTYTGARLESLRVDEQEVAVELVGRESALHLVAAREAGAELAAPSAGVMRGRVVETLRATIDVRLEVDGRVRFEGRGASAGLEVVRPEALLPRIGPSRARR